jgi:hypothetical protein
MLLKKGALSIAAVPITYSTGTFRVYKTVWHKYCAVSTNTSKEDKHGH